MCLAQAFLWSKTSSLILFSQFFSDVWFPEQVERLFFPTTERLFFLLHH